jgi:cysteine-rich repeat protein
MKSLQSYMKNTKFIFLSVLFAIVLTGFVQACHCGDNSVNVVGEECDGSDLQGKTCFDFGFDAGKLSCENCLYDTSNCYDFECGNSILEGLEECDDGNLIDGDGCSSDCKIEIIKQKCGDGIKDEWEECDNGILNGFLCWAGYEDSCTYCTSSCKEKTIYFGCGDNIVQSCEECDDGNLIDGDGCSSDCKIEIINQKCGDGIKDEWEECDNGILNGFLCSAGYESYCEYCTSECLIEEIEGPYCGDGNLDSEFEECDDGNLIDGDGCSSDCLVESPVCGNSVVEGSETCDVGSLNGVLCSAGYESYCEYCTSECQIETVIGPYCGDGICQENENYNSCSNDCDKKKKDDSDDEENEEEYIYFKERCVSNWNCSSWSLCEEGIKTRECYDENACSFSSAKPSEIMICEIFESSKVQEDNNDLLLILIIFSSFFFLTYLALFMYYKLK